MTYSYQNAQITSTKLGNLHDRDIMTFWIYLDYGNSCHQGFGGYSLDQYNKDKKEREQTKLTGDLIANILRVLELDSWEDLKGKYIRAIVEGSGLSQNVVGVAHIIKEKEFNFKEFLKENY